MKKIAIMGLCGIGMSAIAQFLQSEGHEVFGSDINYKGQRADKLKELGLEVYPEDGTIFTRNPDFIIKSSGVKEDNCELIEARKLGIKLFTRQEIMAQITRGYERVLAVAGTHGKTTSTTLLAELLTNLNLNPTIFTGGIMAFCKNNFKLGGKTFLILESDESDGTFLEIKRDLALVTNINWDHPDFFQSFEDSRKAFEAFLQGSEKFVILGSDGKKVPNLKPFLTYGFDRENHIAAVNLEKRADGISFELFFNGKNYPCFIKAFGEHNVLNALGVLAVTLALDLDQGEVLQKFQKTIATFQGVARRFNILAKNNRPEITVIDDYAHHPNEIKTTIAGALAKGEKLIVVWEPHKFSRVQTFLQEFLEAFYLTDYLLISEIYSSGEKSIPGLSGAFLAEELIKRGVKTFFTQDSQEIFKKLDEIKKPGNKILFLGAGSSSDWAHSFA